MKKPTWNPSTWTFVEWAFVLLIVSGLVAIFFDLQLIVNLHVANGQ